MPFEWLDTKHEIFDANVDRWEQNERRLRGGDYVLNELRAFIWETLPGQATASVGEGGDPRGRPMEGAAYLPVAGAHYTARQQQATYNNFPEMFVMTVRGHLMRNRPTPGAGLNFGTLGQVGRERNYNQPTPAEMMYYNADGVGNDGSQWDNFWLSAWGRAAATGHRWIFVEAPAEFAGTRERELQGFRPYLVEYSPQQVTNWHFERGRLSWAVVRVGVRSPMVKDDGTMKGNDMADGYLLLVRRGVQALGSEFARGGWFLFDADKQPLDTGNWDRTRGDIPLFPLYYERDAGVRSLDERWKSLPNMSRPGTTELGQAAVAYMNLESASEFDAWDAAASVRFMLGVDEDGFNLASSMWAQGSQIVPVPANASGTVPQVQDGSIGAVAAGVFDTLLRRKMEEAQKIALQESVGSVDASGVAKEVGFGDLKAPRLANIASEIEQAQNVAIYFLELRWGNANPSGSVIWPREFEVVDVVQDIKEFFTLEQITGYKSPTMGGKLMVRAAQESGFITDDEEQATVEAEYTDAVNTAITTAKANATLLADFGAGGGGSQDTGGNGGGSPDVQPPPTA